jgi:hypothetical protein
MVEAPPHKSTEGKVRFSPKQVSRVLWLTKSSLNKSFHYSEFNNHQRVPPVPATPEQLLDQSPPPRTLPIYLVVLADDPDQPVEALGHAVPLQHHAQLVDWTGQKTLPSEGKVMMIEGSSLGKTSSSS